MRRSPLWGLASAVMGKGGTNSRPVLKSGDTRRIMKPYTVEITINLPRDRVIELFESRDNLYAWQTGLVSFEHVSGEPGHPGAKSKLVYVNGKQRFELMETITKRDLPLEYNATFESDIGINTIQNRFVPLGPERTKWVSTVQYEFTGFVLKMMGFLVPGIFRKENLKFMNQFKAFCEEGADVRKERG
jgi:hypothetical protein